VSAALSSFSLSFTCSVFALLAIHCSRNALMQEASPRPLDQLNHYDAERAAQKLRHPRICFAGYRSLSPKALNSRLTLFLQPNHGFGESFCHSSQRRPQQFIPTLRGNPPEGLPKPSIRLGAGHSAELPK
jgi:hypothetical protein